MGGKALGVEAVRYLVLASRIVHQSASKPTAVALTTSYRLAMDVLFSSGTAPIISPTNWVSTRISMLTCRELHSIARTSCWAPKALLA